MENLDRYNLVELSDSEAQSIDGGWFFLALGCVIAFAAGWLLGVLGDWKPV
jgi:hypothetical protein